MITTKQLLELGFKKDKIEDFFIDDNGRASKEYFHLYKVDLYNEDETTTLMKLHSSDSINEDNNEWSVFTGTEYVDLEFKDFNQLTTYIQLIKDNYIQYTR